MSINPAGNRLAIADYNKNHVVEFSISGDWLTYTQKLVCKHSSGNGYFQRPTDTGYDSSVEIFMYQIFMDIEFKNSIQV